MDELHRQSISRGLKLAYKEKRRTGFQKNIAPWNKGLHYIPPHTTGLAKGHGFFKGKMIKESYANIHYWVRKQKGKPVECVKCGKTSGRIEWANIGHTYKQVLDDYISLCCKCHYAFDKRQ